MKIIIGGTGKVGFNLASFLSIFKNDITVIDNNPDVVRRVNSEIEANGILGSISNPEIQDKANVKDADIFIALTPCDEVNMVACQIAHSIFKVPMKMARIRNVEYKKPQWMNLFSRDHMPIDYIISPESEVAKAIRIQLNYLGMTSLTEINDGAAHIVSVVCNNKCPFLNTDLSQLPELLPTMKFKIVAIERAEEQSDTNRYKSEDKITFPKPTDQIYEGDEVSFICSSDQTGYVLEAFGYTQSKCHNNIIIGGGNIGQSVVEEIQNYAPQQHICLIERDEGHALELSKKYEDVLVLHGSGLNKSIINEAMYEGGNNNIIVTTDDDETNILAPLLAHHVGQKHIVTLLNKDIYHDIIIRYPDISIVSPKDLVVQKILSHLQKNDVRSIHVSHDHTWQIYEVNITKTCPYVFQSIHEISLPKHIMICGIFRKEQLFLNMDDLILNQGDRLLIAGRGNALQAIESHFTPAYSINI